jgi:mRNA interferase HigB
MKTILLLLFSESIFNFQQKACYVIWFGTHKEYDKIDVTKVPFDTSILNYKKR